MQKKLLLAVSLLFSVSSHASFWLGASHGGSLDAEGITMGIRGDEWGVSMSAVFNSDYSTSAVNDYDPPHNDYVTVKKGAYVGNALGFDVMRYFNLRPDHSVYLGAGAYFMTRCDVARSNITDWMYCNNKKTIIDPEFSAGYMVNAGSLLFGLGYHTARGMDVSIGTRF